MTGQTRLQFVDSTLREGEQHPGVCFRPQDRIDIACALDRFGIDIIEVPTPIASPQASADIRALANLNLRARVASHIRCHPTEVREAADCGADLVHMYMGSSHTLREHGHGRNLDQMFACMEAAAETLHEVGIEGRFSCEDAFRTPISEISRIVHHAEDLGFSRVGMADTAGAATPCMVTEIIGLVRRLVSVDIEFHGHNDSGCAVANAHAAYLAGATHIDVTALGLGERNGITALSDFVARLWVSDRNCVEQLCLDQLPAIDRLVAERAGVQIPFTSCISGEHVFTHKAGPHVKAVASDPTSYEALDPASFGRERTLDIAHRLTGRAAVAHRASSLGIELTPTLLQSVTEAIKSLSDHAPVDTNTLDALILQAAPLKGEDHGNAI